jgi:hypothetical protein
MSVLLLLLLLLLCSMFPWAAKVETGSLPVRNLAFFE